MKRVFRDAAASSLFVVLWASAATENPIQKVVALLTKLQAQTVQDGEKAAAAYHEYAHWCERSAQKKIMEIETAKMQRDKLEARSQRAASGIEDCDARISELVTAIAGSDADVQSASKLRATEMADFNAAEAQLMETLKMLAKATQVLKAQREKGVAFVQTGTGAKELDEVVMGLSVVVDAAGIAADDRRKLEALFQMQQGVDDNADALGTPDAPAYSYRNGTIVKVLEDLYEKAAKDLKSAREAETQAIQNNKLTTQALQHQKLEDEKDLDEEKASRNQYEKDKAQADGDLESTSKSLKAATTILHETQAECLQTAADHEKSVKGRTQELDTLSKAKKLLQSTMSGAESRTYSLLQFSSRSSARSHDQIRVLGAEIVNTVKRLANQHHSHVLAQLSSRIGAVVRYGLSGGEDPFKEVKVMLKDLIAKLQRQASMEATEKEYCDKELADTATKVSELQEDAKGLKAKIDIAVTKSAQLKEEVRELQTDIASVLTLQSELDKARVDAHKVYVATQADLKAGLAGVRSAIRVLREYYAAAEDSDETALLQEGQPAPPAAPENWEANQGAGAAIIGLLEVIESDIATNLAQEDSEETESETAYKKATQDNSMSKALKNADIRGKTQEFTSTDREVQEISADYGAAGEELAAVLEYDAKVKDRCVEKPDGYAVRKENVVTENAPGVGNYGGECTCPDGKTYQVGDWNDSCESLACIGGSMNTCNRHEGAWSQRKVVCKQENVVTENAPGVGFWGGECTCPDGKTYEVGDSNDSCGSLACIGGSMNTCNHHAGAWSQRKVVCKQASGRSSMTLQERRLAEIRGLEECLAILSENAPSAASFLQKLQVRHRD